MTNVRGNSGYVIGAAAPANDEQDKMVPAPNASPGPPARLFLDYCVVDINIVQVFNSVVWLVGMISQECKGIT